MGIRFFFLLLPSSPVIPSFHTLPTQPKYLCFTAARKMRLLNTTTLELVEFHCAQIPQYAILSHTWEEGEVLLADIQNHQATGKFGYRKICGCCHVARKNGLQWAWIDTCCIDKSSSSELSEAINSMYRWYANAALCLVYLQDFEGNQKDFGESRWFTRGWTLQELIAPVYIEFYTSKWEDFGTKTSLALSLSRITQIPVDVLRGQDPTTYSVSQRMSWAARRVTTREEDVAYCLLGLFNVNMPLLYGEGKRSFIRLQEQILRQEEDYSIFAWMADDPYQYWDHRLIIRSKEDYWMHAYSSEDDTISNQGMDEFFDELDPGLPVFHTFYDATWTNSAEHEAVEEGVRGFLADSPAQFEGDGGRSPFFRPLRRLNKSEPVQFRHSLAGLYQPYAANRLDQPPLSSSGFHDLQPAQITQHPPELTARGLRATLPVLSTGCEAVPLLAWLYCESDSRLICIALRETDKTSTMGLYGRGYAHLLFAVDTSLTPHFSLRQIFLQSQQTQLRGQKSLFEISGAGRWSVDVTVEDESWVAVQEKLENPVSLSPTVLIGMYCHWSSPQSDSLHHPFMVFCGRVRGRLWCAVTEAEDEAVAERAKVSPAVIVKETASSLYEKDPLFSDKADRLSRLLPQGMGVMGVSIRENMDTKTGEARYTLHIGTWRGAIPPLWVTHADP